MIALFLAVIIVLGAGVKERGAFGAPRDVLTGREFLTMFMRGASSPTKHRIQRYHNFSENELIDRGGYSGGSGGGDGAENPLGDLTATTTTTAAPVTTTPPLTTLDFLDAPSTTDPSLAAVETTSLSPETEPPQASQIVAVSVSSSVVRQRPATLYVETQDEPSFSAAVQSHFSVDEGSLTIQHKDQSQDIDTAHNIGASSHFTVERTQDGEKTSLVVRQNNGEASSHFSIRQNHSPARLIQHHLTSTTTTPSTTTTTEAAVEAIVQEVNRLGQTQKIQEEKHSELEKIIGVPRVAHQTDLRESLTGQLSNLNKGNDKRTELDIENEETEEGRREERTSFSIGRERKNYEPTYQLERKEERTSYSIGAQIARQPKHSPGGWEVPEANYEVDEAVSVMTNGRAHGIQPQAVSPQQQAKSGYVVEGRNFRKYRVEEKTPDGFIVGEYGVVSHDDGSLRGVRYTADSNINPRLIYDALVKFLSLK